MAVAAQKRRTALLSLGRVRIAIRPGTSQLLSLRIPARTARAIATLRQVNLTVTLRATRSVRRAVGSR